MSLRFRHGKSRAAFERTWEHACLFSLEYCSMLCESPVIGSETCLCVCVWWGGGREEPFIIIRNIIYSQTLGNRERQKKKHNKSFSSQINSPNKYFTAWGQKGVIFDPGLFLSGQESTLSYYCSTYCPLCLLRWLRAALSAFHSKQRRIPDLWSSVFSSLWSVSETSGTLGRLICAGISDPAINLVKDHLWKFKHVLYHLWRYSVKKQQCAGGELLCVVSEILSIRNQHSRFINSECVLGLDRPPSRTTQCFLNIVQQPDRNSYGKAYF